MKIDPEAERKRLQERYAQMSKGELEKVAAASEELTEEARAALRAEIARRGWRIEVRDPSGAHDEIEYRRLITIRKFRDLPEALAAKGALDSAGIECTLADDNIVRMDWFWSNLMGGVKLQVAPEDAEAALELLDEPQPASIPGEGEEAPAPRCPQCGSLKVGYESLNEPVAYGTAFLGVPLPVHRKGWYCQNCKHHWQGEERE
jgi:hypothetical protein